MVPLKRLRLGLVVKHIFFRKIIFSSIKFVIMAANYFLLNSFDFLWLNYLNYIIKDIVIKLNAKTIKRLTWKQQCQMIIRNCLQLPVSKIATLYWNRNTVLYGIRKWRIEFLMSRHSTSNILLTTDIEVFNSITYPWFANWLSFSAENRGFR